MRRGLVLAVVMRAVMGFTLIELLVTIAVLAIVVALGVPMYGQFTRGSAVSACASDMVAALAHARSEAVLRKTRIRVAAVDGAWPRGVEVHDDSANPSLLRVTVPVSAAVPVDLVAGDGVTSFHFDEKGRVDVPGNVLPVFTLCPQGGGDGRLMSLDRFGHVTNVVQPCPAQP